MDIVTLLVLVLLVGWLATLIMETDVQKVSLLNFVVGMVGAWLGGGVLAPRFGISAISEYGFSMAGTLVSLVAALFLLAVVKFARRIARSAEPVPLAGPESDHYQQRSV
ncbi:MAG: GlsB/YeaQ/YmgE family stress response membrane protein [Gammaproteobacteria bacterium]|nr:MAG: GlsB/YeaQ/YmgE family stress response membrane protein [Gammaproteobacteria bacterium]